jgi:hypothetical protein
MRKFYKTILLLAFIFTGKLHSQICNSAGNLVIYSNYDGGIIYINCDVNISNLKIGICTYEAAEIHITGTFSNNVTGIIYAGYDGGNDNCSLGVTSTSIIGSSSQTINVYPPVGYLAFHGNGNSSGMDGCHQCDTINNSGGDNTPDEVVFYFLNAFPGSVLRSHHTQYNCWAPTTFSVSAGGNCCIMPPNSTPCVPPPAPTPVVVVPTLCAGSSSSVGATSTTTINWFATPTSNTILGTGSIYNTPTLTAGTHTFYAEAINACNVSPRTAVTLTVYPVATLTVSGTPSICMGQTATLSVTGAGNYTWSTSQTTSMITVSPSSVTVYTVTGKSSPGNCPTSATIAVNVTTCTLLYDISTSNIYFNIFPNPANTILHIEMQYGKKKVEISDLAGKLVYADESTQPGMQINVTNLSKGVYIITVQQDGLKEHKRLIIE